MLSDDTVDVEINQPFVVTSPRPGHPILLVAGRGTAKSVCNSQSVRGSHAVFVTTNTTG
jgi:hypothetical protein